MRALAQTRDGTLAGGSVAGLDVSWRTDRSLLVATIGGALDAAIAPALREFLLRMVHTGGGRLIIDLSAVTHADINGLTVLVGIGRRASLLGGRLGLAAPAAEISGLLRATGLDRQLRLFPSVEAAISGFGSR